MLTIMAIIIAMITMIFINDNIMVIILKVYRQHRKNSDNNSYIDNFITMTVIAKRITFILIYMLIYNTYTIYTIPTLTHRTYTEVIQYTFLCKDDELGKKATMFRSTIS